MLSFAWIPVCVYVVCVCVCVYVCVCVCVFVCVVCVLEIMCILPSYCVGYKGVADGEKTYFIIFGVFSVIQK